MSKFSKKINTIGFLGVFAWVCLLMANPVFPGRSFGSEIPKERLKPGSPAFHFRYKDSKGNWVELKDFKGKYGPPGVAHVKRRFLIYSSWRRI